MGADASALRQELIAAAFPIIDDAAHSVERDLAASAPTDTGEMSQSGEVSTSAAGTGATASVTFTADHASFQDEGTGPHTIQGSPFLAFEIGGQTVIVRSVQHPGSTKNRGWFTDRFNELAEPALQAAADSVLG